jgi:hypothetical protein
VNSRASSDFWKCYEQLPGHIQRLADKNFRLWKINPWHPSLRFKSIKGRLWSARVGDHYRAMAMVENDTATWIWIGTHESYNRLG